MTSRTLTKAALLKEIERLQQGQDRLEQTVRQLKEKNDVSMKNVNRLSRQIWSLRSLINMPELYLDENWNIVGYSGTFPFISQKVVELTRNRAPLSQFLKAVDVEKIKEHLKKEQDLATLPYSRGGRWQLRYKGPGEQDGIGSTWIVYNEANDRYWEIIDSNGKKAIRHNPIVEKALDCSLMSRQEYGGVDEDVRMAYTVKTSRNPEHILDASAILSGGSGLEESGPYYVGYAVASGSFHNSESRIERQGAVVISRPESLEPDTEYRINVERTGGRITRQLTNMSTGEESLPIEYIDSNAIYERQNHVGFYTYSGELEISDIEIWTRKSRFSLEQFRIPFSIEVELEDEQLRGKIFNLKIASNIRIGKTLYVLLLEDITDRKRAERALMESERKYRTLFEDTRVPLCLISTRGRFLDINQAMLDTFGFSSGQMLSSSIDELFIDQEELLAFRRELTDNGYVRNFETRLRKINNSSIDCLITLSVKLDTNDMPEGYLGSMLDITERNWMKARLAESQRMEVIGKLASGVAHEVRNPLNNILAITETLFENNEVSPENQSYMELFRVQVNRLSTLMKDLLDLGKPAQPEKFTRNSLVEICSLAKDLWEQSTEHKATRVSLITADYLPDQCILGDNAKLQQVIINLLENAAQNSDSGSTVDLVVKTESSGQASILVRDSGAGVPPEILNEVFKPFFTTRKKGSGLGLSIVKSIVENHGGKISIQNNNPPPGCSVEIILPADRD